MRVLHTRGFSFFHHLVRVQEILASWGCDEETQLVALCHALYTTQSFKSAFLDINNRTVLQEKIGAQAEHIVYMFALLDRESITYDVGKNQFIFRNYVTGEVSSCSYMDGLTLIHLMLANDIDHIDVVSMAFQRQNFRKYKSVRQFLKSSAQCELDKLIPLKETLPKEQDYDTFIRFIGHSGVQIANSKTSVVIDPWLYDSSREKPIIEGFDPTQRTIDYLIPEPRLTTNELSPDIICLSHFHTHHSPLREITEFAKLKEVTIICPPLTDEKLASLRKKIGDYIYSRIHFIFVSNTQEIKIGETIIQTSPHWIDTAVHLIFYVQLSGKSLIHIVDAVANHSDFQSLSFSKEWEWAYNVRPDFLFVGAAGHLLKMIRNGKRIVLEATTLTPAQAALLTSRVLPRYAGVIGIYNHSVWDDRYEMTASVGDAESQFNWCLSYLAPSVQVKKLLPGDTFY